MLKLVAWTMNAEGPTFYEGGVDAPEEEDRVYQSQFLMGETRFVYSEINLVYPLLSQNQKLALEYIYYGPDGSNFDKNQFEVVLFAGTESTLLTFRNGMEKFNRWAPGDYTVEILVDGKRTAENSFVIIDNGDTFIDDIEVHSILLFETELDEVTDLSDRVYLSTFAHQHTRAIFAEIDFSYPQVKEDKCVIFEQVFYDPDGNEFGREQFEYYLWEGTESSMFEMGWGYNIEGNWLCGSFRMQIFLNGKHLGDKLFEIITNNIVALTPTLTLESMLFFDSEYEIEEVENRVYQTKFSKETSRYITWELNLTYPTIQKRKKLNIQYIYLKPDQSVLADIKTYSYLERGWNFCWISRGWGYDNPGRWETGIYTVIIKIDGKIFCEDHFEIE